MGTSEEKTDFDIFIELFNDFKENTKEYINVKNDLDEYISTLGLNDQSIKYLNKKFKELLIIRIQFIFNTLFREDGSMDYFGFKEKSSN